MISVDLETHLIHDGLQAPPVVCVGMYNGIKGDIYNKWNVPFDRLWGTDRIIGANIAFDMVCICAYYPDQVDNVFRVYEEGKVWDVTIAYGLDAIARGCFLRDPVTGEQLKRANGQSANRYSLSMCAEEWLDLSDAKGDLYWRTRYALLEDVSVAEWPEDAIRYQLSDTKIAYDVAVAQLAAPIANMGDMTAQCQAAFALRLGAVWGFRVDGKRLEGLRSTVDAMCERRLEYGRDHGFVIGDTVKKLPLKKAVARAYGSNYECTECLGEGCKTCDKTGLYLTSDVPKAPKGGVSTNRDALLESGDEVLMCFGENKESKVQSTYIPWLEKGVEHALTLSPNSLKETGRTSYDDPSQTLPRSGRERACIRAREGRVLGSTDVAAGELCTLSQICFTLFGYSAMRDIINETKDPGRLHTALAARMIGTTTEDLVERIRAKDVVAKNARQAAKPPNFGFPGSMGAARLILASRGDSAGTTITSDGHVYPGQRFCVLVLGKQRCGVKKTTEHKGHRYPPICVECLDVVEQIKLIWKQQWPEIQEYHSWVKSKLDEIGGVWCFGPGVDRFRGRLDFGQAANNGFQALMADAAKHALWLVTKEAYTDRGSPLFRARVRIPSFAHDELITEHDEDLAHESGPRVAELMICAMKKFTPDVYVSADTALMRHWYKQAEPRYNEQGRLILWK